MAKSHSKWSKREVLRTFFRFKRRALAAFIIPLIAACIGLCLCPRKYSSEAKVLVRLGRENLALDPTATTGAFVSINDNREAEMNSVIESLRSRSNIEKVLDAVGGESEITSPNQREGALAGLDRSISLYSPKNSTVVVLSTLASSPERAQKIVQSLLDVCLKEHIRVNRTQGSYEFFDEQASLLKSQLDEASAALRDAKNRYGLVTLEGRRNSLQQQINAVELQQQDTKTSLAASSAKIADMSKQLDSLPALTLQQMVGGSPNNGLSDMRQRLFELQTREQSLLSRKTEKHPDVIAIRQQVREAQRILAKEMPQHDQAASAILTGDKSQAASLSARDASLAGQHNELTTELQKLNEQELEIVELERRVKLLDENYVTYAKGLEQARIDEALKKEGISNLSVIQTPSFVPKAAVPKKQLALMMALFAAVGSAVGVVLLSDYLDESLHNVAEAERRLNRRVFVSLPCTNPLANQALQAI